MRTINILLEAALQADDNAHFCQDLVIVRIYVSEIIIMNMPLGCSLVESISPTNLTLLRY